MRIKVRRLAILVATLQSIQACFDACDVVSQRVYRSRKPFDFVATGCVAAFLLQVFANICTHSLFRATSPAPKSASKFAQAMSRNVANDARDGLQTGVTTKLRVNCDPLLNRASKCGVSALVFPVYWPIAHGA